LNKLSAACLPACLPDRQAFVATKEVLNDLYSIRNKQSGFIG
jgi:hypothetical protein